MRVQTLCCIRPRSRIPVVIGPTVLSSSFPSSIATSSFGGLCVLLPRKYSAKCSTHHTIAKASSSCVGQFLSQSVNVRLAYAITLLCVLLAPCCKTPATHVALASVSNKKSAYWVGRPSTSGADVRRSFSVLNASSHSGVHFHSCCFRRRQLRGHASTA